MEKKILKRFAFSQKSETNLPSANSGGIAGIFLLQNKRLRIAQYILGAVEGFWSLVNLWINRKRFESFSPIKI